MKDADGVDRDGNGKLMFPEYVAANKATPEELAEEMGYDAAINKPNTTNSHFSLFATKELMEAWSRGKRRGEQDMATGTSAATEPDAH